MKNRFAIGIMALFLSFAAMGIGSSATRTKRAGHRHDRRAGGYVRRQRYHTGDEGCRCKNRDRPSGLAEGQTETMTLTRPRAIVCISRAPGTM